MIFNNAGLPTKSAEYAISGKPIIASKVGDIPKYFTHLKNIYLYDDGDEYGLQNGIETLIHNEQLSREIGNNAKEMAMKKFEISNNGENIVKKILIYENNEN